MTQAALSPAVAKPAHVPDALLYDFDMRHDPALLADPHERVLDLLKTAPPIFWTPRNSGHWMTISHASNFEAARDPETFSSALMPQAMWDAMVASLPPGSPHVPVSVPVGMDPPQHTQYRIPLNGAFSPKMIAALRNDITTLAGELIDRVAPRKACEFMTEIGEIMPVQVFLKMLGLPMERMDEYRSLVKESMKGTNDVNFATIAARRRRVADAMRDVLLERRENPKDDLISMLWRIEVNGKKTTIDDMENYGTLLFVAGLDTVTNGMGHGVRHLARDLPLQRRLRENPQLIGEAAEELLRRYSISVPMRRVAKDTTLQGVEMKAGDRLMLFLPGANLDAAEYENPEAINLEREKAHMAYNVGPHRCLGSHLARIQLQILYEQMLARLPEFRLDPAHTPTFHAGNVLSVDSLHLIWD